MNITELLKARAELVEAELLRYVSDTDPDFGVIFDAMRYSLLAGGKRLRPFLVLEFARLAAIENADTVQTGVDTVEKYALPYACAIEMIHTYSLIHDDLPCMDNDDLRRGMPTSHKKFGEANALLAGDALLTKAFETASSNTLVSDKTNCMAINLLARCAGAMGMIGGQVLDLEGEKQSFGISTLEKLQSLKTGELIRCASLLGCYAGGASDKLIDAAQKYALGIGRAFQVVDDILDVVGDEALLGKPIGSDADSGKTTFATIMTIDEARKYAEQLTDMAIEAVSGCKGSETLIELAKYLLSRNK